MGVKGLFIFYIISLVVIFVFPFSSSVSINRYEISFIRADHLIHVVIFIPLYYFLNYLKKDFKSMRTTTILLLFSLLIATLFELLHLFIPYRSFTTIDLVSNLIGVTIGFILVLLKKKFQ